LLTTRLTLRAVPQPAVVFGFCEITRPFSILAEKARVTLPTTHEPSSRAPG
jgi:hypothetical protein